MDMYRQAGEGARPQQRVDWVDYAKGICIIWVVTLYSTDFVRTHIHGVGWMQYLVDFAQPFRMPDFFMLSGLFVARAMEKPWRTYLDKRVVHFAYFYLLWGTLKFVHAEWAALLQPDRIRLVPEYLQMLVVPPTGPLWFLYVLALFSLAVRLLRAWPPLLVLAIAAALQLAMPAHDISFKLGDKFCRYFVFFVVGYLFARHLFRLTDWARAHPRTNWAIFAVWFAWNGGMVARGLTFLPGMQLLMGCIGAVAIMLLATRLAEFQSTTALRWLGRNSIVIYLGFVVPLGLMRSFVVASAGGGLDAGTLSLLVTVLSVAGAAALYFAVRNTPLRFLFVRPRWISIMPTPLAAMPVHKHPEQAAGSS